MTSGINKKDLNFQCKDGCELAGTQYIPAEVRANGNAILFAPATGMKRGFYNSLASHLTSIGYSCLTFENRGVGDSLRGSIKDCKASLIDWGTLDLAGAFNELQRSFPNHKYHIVGHSAGGQLLGLIPNWNKIGSIFNFACSSGQIDQMSAPFRYQARFFLDIFIPISNKLFGYTKSELVGMGESLPSQVAADWRHWCNAQGYVETDFGKRIQEHWFYEMDCPSLWVNASDDSIANNHNVDDMTRVFTKMPIERVELDPSKEGLKEIGHMKFFSKKSEKLWPYLTNWLEKHA
ncbi:alpha/beta fold hydrolase [Neptuniibacter sp. PT8_73]|uniref:alpha/beta hydrolase family protein n=1 Tax=Neptuniibacter sp. PT8_73 TaxID=3398206 RepID=UPI0039F4FC2E